MQTPVSMSDIDTSARNLRGSRDKLAAIVTALNNDVESIKRTHMPAIKRAVSACAEDKLDLINLIDRARGLFDRPRTLILHGIKCGITKGKGKIQVDDTARSIELAERHLSPAQCDLVIKTTKTLIKKALANLDTADLKRIGCQVSETGDFVLVKFTDSEVDKIVRALLKDATEDTQKAA